MQDIIVVGGGVIGLSVAYELAGRGYRVRVLEQGQFGREASWAGAGMLPPGQLEHAATMEARLRGGSCRLWPAWAQRLTDQTGIPTGYRRCGAVEVRVEGDPQHLAEEIAQWRREGVAVEPLTGDEARSRFPALGGAVTAAYWMPEYAQVRNPWLLRALESACLSLGVELSAGVRVTNWEWQEGRITHVRAEGERYAAGQFVLAGGAWSQALLARVGYSLELQPVRGQMVLLEQRPLPLDCVVQCGARYIVPRSDGRILIGSTEEDAGFDKRNTAAGVAGLLTFGMQLVPELGTAQFDRAWAGLRPWRPGGLPCLGRAPGYDNLVIAAGHFRAGLQLSPVTAVLVRQLVTGEPLMFPIDDLMPDAAAE